MVLLFLSKSILGQQSEVLLKGSVVDSKGNRIETGSLFFRTSNGVEDLSKTWNNGGFSFKKLLSNDSVSLIFSSPGFVTKTVTVKFPIDRPTVELEPTILARDSLIKLHEVTVLGKKDVIQTEQGNTVINIANSMLNSSNSIDELFSKLPGVNLNSKEVSIIGKGNAIIYLDKNRITIEQLKLISIERIDKIQLITNPSAKYDSQGNAVIQILSKKILSEGFTGQIRQGLQKGVFFNQSGSISADYNTKKLSFSAGLQQNSLNREVTIFSDYASRFKESPYSGSRIYKTRMNTDFIPTYRLGIGYDVDEKTSFSIEYKGNTTNISQAISNVNETFPKRGDPSDSSATVNRGTSNWSSNSISFNINRDLDTLGSNLFFGGQYFSEKEKYDFNIDEVLMDQTRDSFMNISNAGNKIMSMQINWDKFFKSGSELSVGVKLSSVKMKSNNDIFKNTASERNFANYRELVPALFSEYKGSFKQLQYNLGVRLESTHIKRASDLLQNRTDTSLNYLNVFPYISMSHKRKESEYGITYSNRIYRPTFYDLSAYVEYNGPSNLYISNPSLLPSYTNSIEVFWKWRKYVAKLGYTLIKDEITTMYEFRSDRRIILQNRNISRRKNLYMDLTIPISWHNFNSENTVKFNVSKVTDKAYLQENSDISPLVNIYSINTLTIPDVFDIELLLNYSSFQSDGVFKSRSNLYTELSVFKKLPKTNLSLRASVIDVLNNYHTIKETKFNGNFFLSDRYITLNSFRVSIIWNFGNLKKSNYKNSSIGLDNINRSN